MSLHGININLFIERGTPLGPVLEVTVSDFPRTTAKPIRQGCEVIKEEPEFPRCYVKDPNGLTYNLIEG